MAVHEWMMHLAISLARRGLGFTSPNPMVGAVLAKGNKVVGVGHHRVFGGPHAEIEALERAGRKARGADLYVSMEPCCFCGKTGACTEALIRAGIKRVIAATLDPHPKVRGRGMRCLREAGIETCVGMLAEDARRLNEAYFSFHIRHRPFVTLKLALSLDGMVAAYTGESKWITGKEARQRAQKLRQASDAVLVGLNTVLYDNPRLDCRLERKRPLLKVVLDAELLVPAGSRFLKTKGPALVLTGRARSRRKWSLERAGAEVVVTGPAAKGLLPWRRILAELYKRDVMSLLVEGGARVAASALDAGTVDKVCLFHAPKVLGPGRNFGAEMKPRSLARALVLKQVRHEVVGDDILTEGYLGK